MAFRGTFDYTLDAKNRLTIPAKFRGSLGDRIVLAKGTDTCISVWRPEDFDAFVEAALAPFPTLSPEADRINRYFQGNAQEIDIDSAGRVGIATFLLEAGGLKKDVVITGLGTRLEVWDRSAWAAYNASLDIHALTASASTHAA